MKGLLIVNTGSPQSFAVKDVRRYLIEFLSDPRIISIPAPFRQLLVRGIIAPFRAPSSAAKYREIFTSEDKSLLLTKTEKLAEKMRTMGQVPVYIAMRYGGRRVDDAFREAESDGVTELRVIPLFPQYAMSSYETVVEHVRESFNKSARHLKLSFAEPYYDNELYIRAVAEMIVRVAEPQDMILCSYHGIPLSQVRPYDTNPAKDYVFQTSRTTELLSLHPLLAGLNATFQTVYQSRFGKGKWLRPSTGETLKRLKNEGRKRIVVACPGFLCDNLETVHEIGIEERAYFEADGRELILAASPNDSDTLARCLLAL